MLPQCLACRHGISSKLGQTERRTNLERLRRTILKLLDSGWCVYAIVGAGLAVRILALMLVGSRPLHYENPSYYHMGLRLLQHENFSPYWPPGVPYWLMIAHKALGDGILVARASILPFYIGFSFVLHALIKTVSTRRAANLAVLAFAFYPSYVRWSFNPSTEYPAALCLVAAVYVGIRTVRKPSYGLVLLLGFFLGALVLVRPSSLALTILAALYLFLKTRRVALALTVLLIPALLISAWLWKAYAMTGRFVTINDASAQDFFLSNNPYTPLYNTCPDGPVQWKVSGKLMDMLRKIETHPPAVQQKLYRQIAFRYVLANPGLFLFRDFNRFRAYFCFPIHGGEPLVKYFGIHRHRILLTIGLSSFELCFYWPLMLLAIVSLFNLRKPLAETDYVIPLLGSAAVYALPYWLTCSQPRYNFPVIPLFAVFAAILADSLIERPMPEVLAPVLHSKGRKVAMLVALAFFCYIQIEWIVFIVMAGR